MGWTEKTVAEIAAKLAAEPKVNDKRKRMVVFTQGAEPTIVATEGGEVKEYPIIPCPELIDTNGAGDAFVGGFLAKWSMAGEVEDCCKAGNYAANVIIQRNGCTFPTDGSFTLP